MIQKREVYITENREHMRDGQGTICLEQVLTGSELPPHNRLLSRITVAKDCSIGEHVHDGECEIFHIVSGKGIIVDDGQEREVQAGDTAVTYAEHRHAVINRNDEPLELLAIIITE